MCEFNYAPPPPLAPQVRVGSTLLSDTLQWDIRSLGAGAEEYATQVCSDLGLAPEVAPAVAHAARTELLRLHREALEPAAIWRKSRPLTGKKRPVRNAYFFCLDEVVVRKLDF